MGATFALGIILPLGITLALGGILHVGIILALGIILRVVYFLPITRLAGAGVHIIRRPETYIYLRPTTLRVERVRTVLRVVTILRVVVRLDFICGAAHDGLGDLDWAFAPTNGTDVAAMTNITANAKTLRIEPILMQFLLSRFALEIISKHGHDIPDFSHLLTRRRNIRWIRAKHCRSGVYSLHRLSKSFMKPWSTCMPPCQNARSRMSIPTRPSISAGVIDPPTLRSSMYFAENASPSFLYIA